MVEMARAHWLEMAQRRACLQLPMPHSFTGKGLPSKEHDLGSKFDLGGKHTILCTDDI